MNRKYKKDAIKKMKNIFSWSSIQSYFSWEVANHLLRTPKTDLLFFSPFFYFYDLWNFNRCGSHLHKLSVLACLKIMPICIRNFAPGNLDDFKKPRILLHAFHFYNRPLSLSLFILAFFSLNSYDYEIFVQIMHIWKNQNKVTHTNDNKKV